MRSNNPATCRPLAAAWGRLVLGLGLGLLLVAAGCSTSPASIGIGLPSVDTNTGAYLVDTLTIRTSTVLRDSVVTSTSNSLLVGRYQDPQLGPIKTTSYTTLNLGGSFQPDRSFIADSAVLVLATDTYRYGDTTQTQTLVNVRELSSFLPVTVFGFASTTLTPMSGRLAPATSINYATPVPRRARRQLGTLRLRLTNAYRDRLMTDGKSGGLTTQEQLDRNYAGLALQPGANDTGALVSFNVSANSGATSGVILYYHDPLDANTVLSHTFSINSARHFYQVDLLQAGNPLAALFSQGSLGKLDASFTGQQTYIQGLLGLQTKIEIPYLFDLRIFGPNLVLTSASMTAEVPATTLSRTLALAPPPTLTVSSTNQRNQQGRTLFASPTYSASISNRDGITQAGYSWSVLSYCQAVLSNSIPNDGMLLNTSTPALAERVVLGGPKRTTNRMQLRLYLISNGK
jgi:hypothetical protein